MVTPGSTAPTSPLSRSVRQRFVAEVDGVILDMAATAQGRLTALADQPGVARDQQARRDALLDFLRLRDAWIQGVRQAWQQALVAPGLSAPRRDGARDKNLTLIGEDEVENGILVSRLVLAISDKVSWELKDLRLRVASLEGGLELAERDVLKPDTFAALLVDQWMRCGISRYSWTSVQDSLVPMLVDRLVGAYQHANEFLIRNGIMPVIETKSVIRRSEDGSSATAAPTSASKSAGVAGGGRIGGRGPTGQRWARGCRTRRIRSRVVCRRHRRIGTRTCRWREHRFRGSLGRPAQRIVRPVDRGRGRRWTRVIVARPHPQRSGRRDPHDDGHHAAGPGSAAGAGCAGAAQAPVCGSGCRL
jgi:hypothetical protein